MSTTLKRSQAFVQSAFPADAVAQEQQQQTEQEEQLLTHSSEKKHKKTSDAKATADTAQITPQIGRLAQDAVTRASQQTPPQAPLTTAATTAPTADLLPTELLQHLMQARKARPAPEANTQLQQRNQQGVLKQSQQQKQKQQIVQVQKGPVKVAVLPAVAAAAEAGTALAAGAAVRQQLLESRIQRSKVMLKPVAPGRRRLPISLGALFSTC